MPAQYDFANVIVGAYNAARDRRAEREAQERQLGFAREQLESEVNRALLSHKLDLMRLQIEKALGEAGIRATVRGQDMAAETTRRGQDFGLFEAMENLRQRGREFNTDVGLRLYGMKKQEEQFNREMALRESESQARIALMNAQASAMTPQDVTYTPEMVQTLVDLYSGNIPQEGFTVPKEALRHPELNQLIGGAVAAQAASKAAPAVSGAAGIAPSTSSSFGDFLGLAGRTVTPYFWYDMYKRVVENEGGANHERFTQFINSKLAEVEEIKGLPSVEAGARKSLQRPQALVQIADAIEQLDGARFAGISDPKSDQAARREYRASLNQLYRFWHPNGLSYDEAAKAQLGQDSE